MSAVHVAEARKGDRIKAINRSIASLDQQIARGAIGAGGMIVQSLAEHVAFCKAEKARLEAEITRLSELSGEDLVAEFTPEIAKQAAIQKDLEENGPVDFDPMGRGPMGPRQVVVSQHPRPVRREGGDPARHAPGLVDVNGRQLPPNVVYGYGKDFNVIPLGQ